MQLLDIRAAAPGQIEAAARILVDALAHAPSAWKTAATARAEVGLFLADADRRALLACGEGTVLGWVGAIAHSACAWELHPLVVDPPAQGRGVGAALVRGLERAAAEAGALTIWLGTDDDFGGTTLSGRDLFPDPLAALREIAPAPGREGLPRHPFTFYLRMGYALCGVLPDADGPGKPDILLAKRVGPPP